MSTSSAFKIIQRYVDHLNTICNLVISDCRLRVLSSVQKNRYIITRFQNGKTLPIILRPKGCLDFNQEVSVSHVKIIIESYAYRYASSFVIGEEPQWLLRYEYNRTPEEHVPHAHLHITVNSENGSVARVHFPTGDRVSIEQVIAHLIYEYGVTPKCDNWFEILEKSHRGFLEKRGAPPPFF